MADAGSAPTQTSGKVRIHFMPQDQVTNVPAGTTIFNAASWIGLPIDSTCGARGTCGKCKVRVASGYSDTTAADHRVFSKEEIAEGWRLSCRSQAQDDVECVIPRLMSNPKAALMGYGRHVILDPNVHKVLLELDAPSLDDQRADLTRVREALFDAGFEIFAPAHVLRRMPKVLREANWLVTAIVVGQELVDLEPGDTTERVFGIAFDIGTTTVVGQLMDLRTGQPAATRSALNAQAVFGADVIARISHAMINEDGLENLTAKVIETINLLIEDLLKDAEVSAHEVYETVLAGNATMMHLLVGLDAEAIGVMPFIPVADDMLRFNAEELGISIHPRGHVHMLPNLGAYVGGDLVGGLLATGLAQDEGVRLLVDVGTNGEIILGSKVRTVSTAAPAGPAFEGAQIRDGMRAADGAIEGVVINEDGVALQVIGDIEPVGLCGSGLLDAVAQMVLTGLLKSSGKFISREEAIESQPRTIADRLISLSDGTRAFVLAWAKDTGHGRHVVLTQRDIRELQFAKAAIASGIDVVMEVLGVTQSDLVEIYLAGSFGSYINPQSARVIGLVPPVAVEKIKAVGNASGEGAKMALLSFRERQVAHELTKTVEYLELSGRGDFNDSFISVLQFPDLNDLGLQRKRLAMRKMHPEDLPFPSRDTLDL